MGPIILKLPCLAAVSPGTNDNEPTAGSDEGMPVDGSRTVGVVALRSLQEEAHGEAGVNEVRVARYRDLLERKRYRRSSRDLARAIVEQDLELQPAPVLPPRTADQD